MSQAAINAGYERAWNTILDSNVTTLIAGIALLIFGKRLFNCVTRLRHALASVKLANIVDDIGLFFTQRREFQTIAHRGDHLLAALRTRKQRYDLGAFVLHFDSSGEKSGLRLDGRIFCISGKVNAQPDRSPRRWRVPRAAAGR